MWSFLQKLFLIGVLLLNVNSLFAQDSVQKQFWPELDIYYRINERFRIYSSISGTESNSAYTDGTAGVYLDFFAFPWLRGRLNPEISDTTRGYYWWFRAGYSYSNSPPGEKRKEVNIFETETNNTFNLPADIVLHSRNRLDWRWVNGDFQPIYRPRIKFVRNLRTAYLTFNIYLWSEYFFYLNDNNQDRLRLTIGSEIKVLKNLDFEVYFLHQFQNKQYVASLNAVGIMFDLYFKSGHYK